MLNIGCHLSLGKGYHAMGKQALSIGANTFQFFTRNPRGGKAKDIAPADAQALKKLVEDNNFAPLLAHAPYTLNLCSAKPEIRKFAQEMMLDDLGRLEQLPCHLYNFHPGSHTTQTVEVAIEQIIEGLNIVMKPEQSTIILLEAMAGKGSEVGRTFQELRAIIDGVEVKDKIGVCLDTCHIYDGGYDIVNQLEDVIADFDKVVGLDRLHAIHLNDSMNPIGSHKDRHEKIGEGTIGLQIMENIINHPKLKHLPFYLETPNEVAGYAQEIELLRGLYRD